MLVGAGEALDLQEPRREGEGPAAHPVVALSSSRTASEARGWTVDSVFDLARVMRLPGTWNNKDPNDRRPVHVTSVTGERYPLRQILDLVPGDFTADGGRPRSKRIGKGTGPPATTGLSVDVDSAPAPLLIEALLELDPRFRQTWEQNRPDLSDQSPSGYEMALAHHTIRAGWPEQEIRSLFAAFRKRHGHTLKNREDYLAMTISKAKASLERADGAAGSKNDMPGAGQQGSSLEDGTVVKNEAILSLVGERTMGTELPMDGQRKSGLVTMLETVTSLVAQDPSSHECQDPAVLQLVTEIRAALTGIGSSSEATSAAARLRAQYSAYVSSGRIEDLEALAVAATSAMGPEVQVPLLVQKSVDALTRGQSSIEPLMSLTTMLRRQTTSVRHRAKAATLAEAAELPLRRSILKAKGEPGSLLNAGEVAILSGMGAAGKSTLTVGLALELTVLGAGVRGEVCGAFEAEGGLVLVVGYEDRLGIVGRRGKRFADYMDHGKSERLFHTALQQVEIMEMRSPIFGPDPYTPLYNARPTTLEGWQELRDRARSVEPHLIVLDPALCAYVGDATSPPPVSEFILTLRDLAEEFDCGVILVSHGTKSARGGGRRKIDPDDPGQVMGTGSWTDRPRCTMTIRPGPLGQSILTVYKANYGRQRIFLPLDPLLDNGGQLIGFSGKGHQWTPLPEGKERTEPDKSSGKKTGRKGLFDD